jgi:hypothetical protein
MIRNELIDYYVDREFKPVVITPHVVKKPQGKKKPVTTG